MDIDRHKKKKCASSLGLLVGRTRDVSNEHFLLNLKETVLSPYLFYSDFSTNHTCFPSKSVWEKPSRYTKSQTKCLCLLIIINKKCNAMS